MGECKECDHWTQNTEWTEYGRMSHELDDELVAAGYGRCTNAGGDSKALPRYDGGYTGELITHADFGCTEFKAK